MIGSKAVQGVIDDFDFAVGQLENLAGTFGFREYHYWADEDSLRNENYIIASHGFFMRECVHMEGAQK